MKSWKSLFGAVLVGGLILWIAGVGAPLVAERARSKIAEGMSVGEVRAIITGYSEKPDVCFWTRAGSERVVAATHPVCPLPAAKEMRTTEGGTLRLQVLYMGPGFLHNDFDVRFDSANAVLSVSNVRHWD